MDEYKIPIDGAQLRLGMEKTGSGRTTYYLSGELSLGETGWQKLPQDKVEVKIPISSQMYVELESLMNAKGEDARIFVNGGLEIAIKVPTLN